MGDVGVKALNNVSLKISSGEFVAIMGPSGSGKSTLLHILGLLDRPDSGSYHLGQKDITKLSDNELALLRNRLLGFVFQQFHLLPRVSALQNAELPLIYAGKQGLKETAHEKIKEVGLAQRESHKPNELSGGEQQRVAIARSLVNEPFIIFADEPTGNLDTKTEAEIMGIINNLNKKGKTIIMVTHEEEIAKHAERIIKMRDGKIISDKRTHKKSKKDIINITQDEIEKVLNDYSNRSSAELKDHLKQSISSIISHKMRSFLSILGILIGVAAVIAMLALGEGAKEAISKSFASLGSNLLMIRPGAHRMGGVSLESGAVTRFTLQDAEGIAKLSYVKRVSPEVDGRVQLVFGNKNWNTMITGAGADYGAMRAAIPTIGRFFTEQEVRSRQKVALIGATVQSQLFGDADPINSTIKINRINFKVIGILPAKGATGFRDQDDVVIIPITTAMYRVLGKEYVDDINAEIESSDLMDKAQQSIQELIIKRHKLTKDQEDSFQIRNMADIQETFMATIKTITMLLGTIAAISLLVGGIGIMNIMLVSVTERTREIGLRKALGARHSDILMQFLIESVVMTLTGGIIGIIVGGGVAMLLSIFANWTTKVSLFSILLATIFSAVVGLCFGLLPAQKAAKLNPVEALRYE